MGCGFGFVFSLLIFLPVTGCAVFLKNRPQGALSLQPKPLDLGDHVEFYLFIYLLIYLLILLSVSTVILQTSELTKLPTEISSLNYSFHSL